MLTSQQILAAIPTSSPTSNDSSPSSRPKPAPAHESICPVCAGAGFVVYDLPVGHPEFGRLVPCDCKKRERAARLQARLSELSGLNEAEQALSFKQLVRIEGNASHIREIELASEAGRGLITLYGPPGTGKTTLMACAVNAARTKGQVGVYTTLTDLLDYLRAAYDNKQQNELTFTRRWSDILEADVLAVDELDEFNTTSWAMERFLRLVDERWRAMHHKLTLVATNSDLRDLPPKVYSRLNDGRAKVLHLAGPDMRQFLEG